MSAESLEPAAREAVRNVILRYFNHTGQGFEHKPVHETPASQIAYEALIRGDSKTVTELFKLIARQLELKEKFRSDPQFNQVIVPKFSEGLFESIAYPKGTFNPKPRLSFNYIQEYLQTTNRYFTLDNISNIKQALIALELDNVVDTNHCVQDLNKVEDKLKSQIVKKQEITPSITTELKKEPESNFETRLNNIETAMRAMQLQCTQMLGLLTELAQNQRLQKNQESTIPSKSTTFNPGFHSGKK